MLILYIFLFSIFLLLFILISNIKATQAVQWIGITATSDNHFALTVNFILSFIIYYPNNLLVIYDMNLNSSNKLYLKIAFITIKSYLISNMHKGKLIYNIFNFSNYPAHFSITNYTWKQVMIYDCLKKYKSMVFWFDGGVEITGNLNYEINMAQSNEMYIEPSIYPINIFLPSIVAKYFSINKSELKNYTTINIALIAVVYSKKMINEIIKPWVDCAYNTLCICPKGVSRKNYRYDQTTLFLILYKNKKYRYLVRPVKLNEFSHKKECDYRNDCNITFKIDNLLKKINIF